MKDIRRNTLNKCSLKHVEWGFNTDKVTAVLTDNAANMMYGEGIRNCIWEKSIFHALRTHLI